MHLCPWDSPGKNAGMGCYALFHGIPLKPGIEPMSPLLQEDSLKTVPPGKLHNKAAADAKSLQSCVTLCDPTGGSPLGSPTPGILQARTLEWVAISFSNA